MVYGDGGGALGWLIGEEHRGLACMFTMMNSARLAVALQGVAIAERAYQDALAFAGERRQGAAPTHNGNGMAPIIEHADVRRMLATMRSLTNAARAICYATAEAIDRSHRCEDAAERQAAGERAALLTPVAKAFATDVAVEVASLGIQVHGGMGFIEETGAAQHLRDARILPIYEGTNGIQAIDLVTRKLPLSGGETVLGQIEEMRQIAGRLADADCTSLQAAAPQIVRAVDSLERATQFMLGALAENAIEEALAGSQPLFAAVCDRARRRAARGDGARGPAGDGGRRQRSCACRTRAARAVLCGQHRADGAGARGRGGRRRRVAEGCATDVGRLSRRAALPGSIGEGRGSCGT